MIGFSTHGSGDGSWWLPIVVVAIMATAFGTVWWMTRK